MTKILTLVCLILSVLFVTSASAATAPLHWQGYSWHRYHGTGFLGQRWATSHVVVGKSGLLNITVANQVGGGVALTQDNQLYATYTVRFRMSRSAGTKYVFLLWPQNGKRPEIDFAEDDHRDNGQRLLTTMSWHPDMVNSHERHFGIKNQDFTNWHIAKLIWKPSGLTFMINSTVVSRITNTSHVPMHLCIQADAWSQQGPPAILQVSSVSITK